MIKGIIEKIIMNTFGKFIQGIQKDKLSVDLFGGNFKLENITLNHDYFNNLNTPFTLAYSSIGKLNLQAPLSKLSSVPVECILDNIYVILQFKENCQETLQSVQAKKQKIFKQIGQALESSLKKMKQQKKQDGMMAKLAKKIIDNLQLKIMNLHIRFEEAHKTEHYAWGLTLESISFTTTDQNWKPCFVERTNQNQEKLFKTMEVKKLNVYWESDLQKQADLLKSTHYNDQQRKSRLAELIQKETNVVLSITSSFKLIINPPEDLQSPLYQIDISLQPLKFQFQRIQLSQMSDFAQKNIIQNQMIARSIGKRNKIKLPEQQKGLLRQRYQQFISQVLKCHQNNTTLSTIEGYDEVLRDIFEKIDQTEITLWELPPLKNKVKNIREMELIKKKSGWFSRGTELSEQQQNQLASYIDQTFKGQKYRREPHLLFFRINTELKGGKMILVEFKDQDIEEKIQFSIGRIVSSVAKSENQSYFEIDLDIESISLHLMLPVQKQNRIKHKKLEIFTTSKPEEYKEQSDEDSMKSFDSEEEAEQEKTSFLKLVYKNQLLEKNTVLKKTISGNIEKVTVIYKRLYMQKFKKFFSFKKNQIVKTAHLEAIDNLHHQEQDHTTEDFQLEKIMDVNLNINSPIFICPLNQQECWCLHFGSLNINSKRTADHEQFPMVVSSAFLRYYPFMKQCYSLKDSRMHQGIYSVISDMDFVITYQRYRAKNEQILNIDLPSFKINFTQQQYDNLQSLTKIFQVQDNEKQSMLELLKEERKQIENQKTHQGLILKKQETLMSYKLYHGILSGEYLYLYNDRQELKENAKFYMKNAKVIARNSENQNDEDTQELELINENDIWNLSSQNKEELEEWLRQLDKKCKSFKTIHELMKDYQTTTERSSKKRGNSDNWQEMEVNKKRKILKFNISQVLFRYNNQEEDCLMEFQIDSIYFSRENMHEWSEKIFKMKKLLITDRIYKFKNSNYQKLIEAYDVHFQEIKGRKKMEGKRKSNLTLNVQDLFINWKPDVLLILMRLMNQHFETPKNYRLDDDIEQSREEHFQQVYNDKKFMTSKEKYQQKGKGIFVKEKRDQLSLKSKWMKETMKTDIHLDKIEINMIHRESHLVILKMESNRIKCSLTVFENDKFLHGTMDTLDLYDMTGYPQKDYSAEQTYPPYKIMTKAVESQAPFIEFRWSSYEPNSFPNEQHVDSFMWVSIAPLYYQYYQQVTFRVIDYLLIQVTLLINQPQMLTVNENLMEQLRSQKNVQQKPIKLLFSQYQQVIKKLIHPTFMDMYCQMQQPTFVFKAEKTSHIFYKLTMQQLIFSNKQTKNPRRFQKEKQIKQFVYEEQYLIDGKDCKFIEITKSKEEELFEPFQISIDFNKLLFEDQINLLFPETSHYDRSFVTLNKISGIRIPHYSRLQYLNINKLVNFNFTFDDQCDELFIHNFKVTKLLSPKPILYQVLVPQIEMTADYNAKENSDEIWKLFRAIMHQFTMEYRRDKQLDSSFLISIGLTELKGFEYQEGIKEPTQHQLLSLSGDDLSKTSTDVIIENKTSGQKIIKMNVTEMNVNVRTGLLQLIFEYTLIEDWVFPEVNKYVTELIFCATVYKMNAELQEDAALVAASLATSKKVNPKIIKEILNHKFGLALFKLEGNLCYKFHRKRNETVQEYQKKLERKQLHYDDFQKMEQTTLMSLILNTEIYRGWTTSAAKRKILEKFTYTYEDRKYLRVADQRNCIVKTSAKRAISIDRWLLKVSFKDIILIMKILNQIGEERKYIDYLNRKTGKTETHSLHLFKETESSSLESLDISFQNLTFYLLNSRRDIFLPILKIIINRINLSKSNTFKKDILKGDLKLVVYYFNNIIFRWQPMLEKVNLFFHKLTYYQENNRVFGSLQSEGPIMVNISRQIFFTLKQTVDSWKKQSEQEQNKFISDSKQIQPLDFISHYIVRNETGYPLDILNEKNQLIRQIGHQEQMDYEFQIGDYDEQNQPEIFIGFRIIHPKYQLMAIKNISFSHEKEYEISPRVAVQNSPINPHSNIVIKPEVSNCKKILMIKSSKYVYNYIDGECQKIALPFDHDVYFQLPKQIHNSIKVSLYEERVTENYRYVGKNGTLKIMKKNLVYNYSPIPLQICGKLVQPNEYVGISEKLTIQDQPYRDSLLKVIKNEKLKEYYIYAECYIVDYYGLAYEFEKMNKRIIKMYSYKFQQQGCPFMVYVLPEDQFKFKASMGKDSSSAPLKTTIGKTNFTLENKKSLCPFTTYSYLSPLENQHINEFRRVVEITPQFMLSNATKWLIKICQAESCDSISLEPYQRIPFFWENKQKPSLIKLALYDGVDFWGWSGDLSIQKSTETIVLRKMSDPTEYRILSIQIEITNTVTFIHIVLPLPKYVLKNNVPGSILQVYQTAILDEHLDLEHSFPKQFVFNAGYKEEKPFGYELPLESHKIQVRVQLDQSLPQFQGVTSDSQSFQDIQTTLQSKTILLRNNKRRIVGKLCLTLCFQNNIKTLKLQSQKDIEQQQNTYEYIVKIPQVGISLIGNYNQQRKEIVHLILANINLELSGNADYTDLNLVVISCRIENQLKSNPIFPVVFESTLTKEAKYFINFLVNRSAKNSRLIHYIGCSINKSWITLTSQEVQVLQENVNKIMMLNDDSLVGHIRRNQMFNNSLPDPQQSIFFVESVIHPLRSNITFKHVNEWGGRLLKTVSSINECPISTEGLKFKQFSCLNMGAYFSHLLKHYQDGIIKMLLPMIGNLTILGSPITFVQKIGSGFKDLVELPAEGFEIGPLQGTKGVVKGAGSLIGNTISGAFNTVESITGSISNGITLLVDDDKTFSKERQIIKNDRSQHLLDGLANGAKSIFFGFKNAITGVITQPVQGAEKNGLPGFLLGTAKGIGGLVIKPISGVIDAASKTAEGIKNTPGFFSSQRKQKFTRHHNPRPFYNYYKQFRNYDPELSQFIKILEQQNRQKFVNLSWCGYYELVSKKQKSQPFLILSYEYLFIYDLKNTKLVKHLKCDSFISVALLDGQNIRLKLWDKKSAREGFLTFEPESGHKKLVYEINVIIRHFTPNFIFS